MTTVRALETKTVEKVWGRDALPPPFSTSPGKCVGEIWFDPPPELPQLLVKYLFTSENLSVQVHPSDADAPPGSRGKDECWLVLSTEPGAKLAVGFAEEIAPQTIRAAAIDGSIEDRLEWFAVEAGDFIYLPAGTVHAIGAGISLVEIQQNSDVTYRLYDYGRPRELHLDDAIAVASGAPHDPALRCHVPAHGSVKLVDGPHFRLDRTDGAPNGETLARYGGRPTLVVPLDDSVVIDGLAIPPGSCGLAGDLGEARLEFRGRALLVQSV
ncbi:putative mannose-6-phosphate isomerase GmuF [Tsuneonella dongtanensis]|uniref:Putative mannose-6-phosphate isomerase GmuF n=1 Tax=Tsuneonella dongtanensis TaxID=692370 RepID=A0A1B2A8W7_9SPHN|nr:class I mannose-6-phosphate isomerase [Tsuneonella dongtanensis]ANY18596.1 putative mannose-6-phosphate isomerase GmuF [Tsuneonella dongtanensis]